MQQTGHPVAPLSMSQQERSTLIWAAPASQATPEPRTESCYRGETSVLRHRMCWRSPKWSTNFCQGLGFPFSSSLLLAFYLPLPLTLLLPFDHYKSKECHWHGEWGGSSRQQWPKLCFARFILFTCSCVAVAVIYWLSSLHLQENVPQTHLLLI